MRNVKMMTTCPTIELWLWLWELVCQKVCKQNVCQDNWLSGSVNINKHLVLYCHTVCNCTILLWKILLFNVPVVKLNSPNIVYTKWLVVIQPFGPNLMKKFDAWKYLMWNILKLQYMSLCMFWSMSRSYATTFGW